MLYIAIVIHLMLHNEGIDNMAKKWYLVNDDGTIEDELDSGNVFLTQKQIDYLNGAKKIRSHFLKVNDVYLSELVEVAEPVMILLQHITYFTGVISFRNGRVMHTQAMIQKLKRRSRSGHSIINKLIELDVIHRKREGRKYYYIFNPFIAHRGPRIAKELYEEFRLSKWNGENYK